MQLFKQDIKFGMPMRGGNWWQAPTASLIVIFSFFGGLPGVFLALLALILLAGTGMSVGASIFILRTVIPDPYGGTLFSFHITGALLCVIPVIAVVINTVWKHRYIAVKFDYVFIVVIGWALFGIINYASFRFDSLLNILRIFKSMLYPLFTFAFPLVLFPYLYGLLITRSKNGLDIVRSGVSLGLVILFAISLIELILQSPLVNLLPEKYGLTLQREFFASIRFDRYRVTGAFGNGLYVGILACLLLSFYLFMPGKSRINFWQGTLFSSLAFIISYYFGGSRTGMFAIVAIYSIWIVMRETSRLRIIILLISFLLLWSIWGPHLVEFLVSGRIQTGKGIEALISNATFINRINLYRISGVPIPLVGTVDSNYFTQAVEKAWSITGNYDLASGWLILLYQNGLLPVFLLVSLLVVLSVRVVRIFYNNLEKLIGLLILIWIGPFLWLISSERMADPMFWIGIGICNQTIQSSKG
jgi:hypothetical protein